MFDWALRLTPRFAIGVLDEGARLLLSPLAGRGRVRGQRDEHVSKPENRRKARA
jgi:hypothetical protein